MDNHLLIISTGNQDLKLICKTTNSIEPEIKLAEIGSRDRRELHQALMNGEIKYKIISDKKELEEQIGDDIEISEGWTRGKRKYIDVNCKNQELDISTPFKKNTRANIEALQNKKGEYLLFPAKLHTVIKSIQAENKKIVSGIIFYTDRSSCNLELDSSKKKKIDEQYSQEPIATGKLIAEWLKTKFPNAGFKSTNFMEGLYIFEGNSILEKQKLAPYDQPIAQKATHIIDSAIQELAKSNPTSNAIVSHTGGIADAKTIITASARLHFHGNMLELHDSEHIPDDPICLADSNLQKCQILPRNAILDAKHLACQRLWEGDFAGAWAVVSHIQEDDPNLEQDQWVNGIKQAANFMENYAPVKQGVLKTLDKLQDFKPNTILLIWKAFQIEASLQYNQSEPLIPKTLLALGSFREIMEVAIIDKYLQKEYGEDWKQVLPEEKLIEWLDIKYLYSRSYQEKNYDDNFKMNKKRRKNMSINSFQKNGEFLIELDYHKTIFFKLMDTEIGNTDKTLKSFRNDIAHKSFKPENVKPIKEYAVQNHIWFNEKNNHNINKLGCSFLARKIVKELFEELDPTVKPQELYKELVEELFQKIHKPIPQS